MTQPDRLTTSSRSAALLAGFAVAAAAVVAPASAASTSSATVTLFLRAPSVAAIDRLAAIPTLSYAQRTAAVRRLTPTPTAHDAVDAALSRAGLAVTGGTSWSVTATGSRALVDALFGTRPALSERHSAAQLAAAVGPLPRMPAGLSRWVSAAFPTTGGPPALRHAAAVPLDGADFRDAYTPANVTPAPGGGPGTAKTTIATLQFSNFDSSDLTNYAVQHGLPDPVQSGQFKAVQVDGGSTDSSGDIEVDLDQESLLSTAPAANQHAYFAPNTAAGFADAFAHVFDDVTGNSRATQSDPHITALSVSYGQCEQGIGADAIKATEPIIAALVAAGVTVFTSSGDFGIYDCGDPTGTGFYDRQADVDYPASSPRVVGVGGTNLQHTSSTAAPNDGSNWQETGWSCSDSVSCQSQIPPIAGAPGGTGGSGGGQSGEAYGAGGAAFTGFSSPRWQRVINDAPFAGQPKRLVPDIAADGDPNTGFVAYTSDPHVTARGTHDVQVGGTSLATPVTAALFTNALAAAGRDTGVGDIHPALYSAYALSAGTSLRDVSTGSNGADNDKGLDPSVTAQPGFDTVTGIGAVLWQGIVRYLFTTVPPQAASASLTLPSLRRATRTTVLHADWSSHRSNGGLAIAGTSVTITRSGVAKPLWSTSLAAASASVTFTGTPGATYTLSARSVDVAGRTSTVVQRTVQVPIDDTRFRFHGDWRRATRRGDIGASHARTDSRGAYATVTATGRVYMLNAVAGPTFGIAGIYLGHHKIRTVDLYAATRRRVAVVIYGSLITPRARRTFTVYYTGRKNSRSNGRTVDVDGLTVAY